MVIGLKREIYWGRSDDLKHPESSISDADELIVGDLKKFHEFRPLFIQIIHRYSLSHLKTTWIEPSIFIDSEFSLLHSL